MATIYYADVVGGPTGVAGTATSFAAQGPVVIEGGNEVVVPFTFTLPSTGSSHFDWVLADQLWLVNVPAGAVIVDYLLNYPAMDASGGLTLSVGLVTAGTALFVSAGITGRAGGLVTPYNGPSGLVAAAVPSAQVAISSTYPGSAQRLMGDVFAITCAAAQTTGHGTPTNVINGFVRYTQLNQTVF